MAIRRNRKFKGQSDAEILSVFEKCPNAVLAELFERYRVLSFGLCIKYLNDREKAKDAVSEVFLRLREDLVKNDIKHFKSWFYVYTKNQCLGILRKAKTARKHEENWQRETVNAYVDVPPPEAKLEQLQNAMRTLKKDQQECIRLFYFQKQSYTEIAGRLSISEKKVKSHLQNGKRNLGIVLNRISSLSNLRNYEQ